MQYLFMPWIMCFAEETDPFSRNFRLGILLCSRAGLLE